MKIVETPERRRKVSRPKTGAIRELVIGADLLSKGCDVFRALSPASSCDLVVVTPDKSVFRIEVRSTPDLKYRPKESDEGNFDVFASVKRNQNGKLEWVYYPDIEEWLSVE